MTTLQVLLHVAAQHDYELHSLDFCTAFLQGSLHEEIWLRRPPGFTGSFPTLRMTLAALGFAPSTADPLLFLCTDTTLLPFYVLVYVDDSVLKRIAFTYSSPQSTPLPTGHSLSAPPSDESVELSGPYPELVGCLMYLMTCTRPDLAYRLSLLARYVAPGRHRKVQWDAAKRVLRYLCSTSGMGLVLGGRARVVLTGHADASWELRWLTYLQTDLGEAPRSPPVLYVDNKAMLALCQEHRLEHRTKHIALRYFLARELKQRGQLRLAYVASQANSVDVFTKALQPCDHQRFCTVLGLVVFTVLFVLLYITLLVNWPCGHLLVLRMRGDVVIHPELALPFLTGLVTSCSPPLCLWGCVVILHNMGIGMVGPCMKTPNIRWAAISLNRDPWWTRGELAEYNLEARDVVTPFELKERRKRLGMALHYEYLNRRRRDATPQPRR
ncbi:unnamed protein product [Closterium sp. NIES-54]